MLALISLTAGTSVGLFTFAILSSLLADTVPQSTPQVSVQLRGFNAAPFSYLAEELASFVSLALFSAMLLTWAAVLS